MSIGGGSGLIDKEALHAMLRSSPAILGRLTTDSRYSHSKHLRAGDIILHLAGSAVTLKAGQMMSLGALRGDYKHAS